MNTENGEQLGRGEELWPGDEGSLPEPTRRALLRLVRGPYVTGTRDKDAWSVILSDEKVLRARLADMFLELVLDRESELAFVRNAPYEDGPSAVRTQNLTFIDTVMLLVLREMLLAEDRGARVIVDAEEVLERMSVFRPEDRDKEDYRARFSASWRKMSEKLGILRRIEEGRAEISPVLRLIVDADQVAALTEQYKKIADQGGDRDG